MSQNSLSWGMRSGTYLEEYIRDSQDLQKYTRLYKGGRFYLDENEHIIDDVRKGHHAYIDWRSNLQYIMRREYLSTGTCDFALSTDEFMDEQIAIVSSIISYIISSVLSKLFHATTFMAVSTKFWCHTKVSQHTVWTTINQG